jgi:shikimate dehydrogenase
MHNAAYAALGLDWVYVPFAVPPERIAEAVAAVRALSLIGVNVTVPLKEIVGAHLDDVTVEAERIGSVNTIQNLDGRLIGHTTDGGGLLWDLEMNGVALPPGLPVFLWGAGGTARAAASALAERGCSVTVGNRTPSRSEALTRTIERGTRAVAWDSREYADALAEALLLINTTTLGMKMPGGASDNQEMVPPLPPGALTPGKTVYDVVYAPTKTLLLKRAEAAGCRAINGLGMLVGQGAFSLSIWSGLPVASLPLGVMRAAALAGL